MIFFGAVGIVIGAAVGAVIIVETYHWAQKKAPTISG
jgi:hypothetical protein